MLRRTRVFLSTLAIAAVPAIAVLSGASAAAVPAAAPAQVLTYHSGEQMAIKHGPVNVRNGGVAVKVGKGHGGTLNLNASASSTNWSGYALDGGTYSSVSASWVEPKGTCTSATRYSSFWVGLDGYSSNSVEQDGTDTDCSGGKPVYYGWYEMYPNPSYYFGNTVAAGDHMSASVTYTATNTYQLVLTDSTQGWSATTTQTLSGAPRSSAEVIIEAPCCTNSGGILPLADFGTVNFTSSVVDGSAIGTQNPTGITMIDNSGRDKDTVSGLTSNENFSATWVRAN